jgi:glutathione S-transferase
MSEMTLYGFDGSTYVRPVKMLLAAKGAEYEQVPVNVLAGEPRQAEHLQRHPFGKVPVLDHDGLRILETSAISRYLDDVLDGPSFIPDNARDRARMDMAVGLIDSYGYGALIGTVAAYPLFPDFVGGVSDEALAGGIGQSRLVITELMRIKRGDPYIAGTALSLADLYLAPICSYVAMTPESHKVLQVPGFAEWWQRMQGEKIYRMTEPKRD